MTDSSFPLIPLQSGAVRLQFDPRLGCLRYMQIGGKEFIRAIYAVVRDEFWTTIPTEVTVLRQDIRCDSFDIELKAACRGGAVDFSWIGRLWGTAQGEVGFEFTGTAASNFLRNRIGICVLHPIPASADGQFAVLRPDGTWRGAAFPRPDSISPHQPATDICGMKFSPLGGGQVEIEFQGEHFEMEDQRNWGDHSFKTYCTPQHRPKPASVRAGDLIRQAAVVRVSQMNYLNGSAAPVQFSPLPAVRRPRLGLVAAADADLNRPQVLAALGTLRLDHLRVSLRLRDSDWRGQLTRASHAATEAGCALHIAVFLTDSAAAELAALKAAAASHPPALWAVFHERRPITPPELIDAARTIFGPDARLAAGTDSSFCELNRERPSLDANWLPAWPTQPQSHLTDAETLAENFPAQLDALRTLSQFCPRPGVVGPITMRKRFANDAWFKGMIETWTELEPDIRQDGKSGAAWLLGSLAWLCRAEIAWSLTYFKTHGPGGVLEADGRLKPAAEALRLIGGSEFLTPIECPQPLRHSAIRLGDGSLLVANHSAVPAQIHGRVIEPWSTAVWTNFF